MRTMERLRNLESRLRPSPDPTPVPTWGEAFAQLEAEIAAGVIEERYVTTGDGRPAFSWLDYRHEHVVDEYYHWRGRFDALRAVLDLIEERLAPAAGWTTAGYAADYRGRRFEGRPQTVAELAAWVDAVTTAI